LSTSSSACTTRIAVLRRFQFLPRRRDLGFNGIWGEVSRPGVNRGQLRLQRRPCRALSFLLSHGAGQQARVDRIVENDGHRFSIPLQHQRTWFVDAPLSARKQASMGS
jgi:hypothetical protein